MRRCIAFPSPTAASPVPGGAGRPDCGFIQGGRDRRSPGIRHLRRCAIALATISIPALALPGGAPAQDWVAWTGPQAASEPAGPDCPAAFNGCTGEADATTPRPARDFIAPGFEFGNGSVLAPTLGIEVLGEHRPDFVAEGRAASLAPVGSGLGTALRSSMKELLAIRGFQPGTFSPFVSGGLGAVRTGSGETKAPFPNTRRVAPGASKVGRAWTVTAGLAVAVGSRYTVEFAWRYTDPGAVETGRGSGRVEWREHGALKALNRAPTGSAESSHGLLLSLRYGF